MDIKLPVLRAEVIRDSLGYQTQTSALDQPFFQGSLLLILDLMKSDQSETSARK